MGETKIPLAKVHVMIGTALILLSVVFVLLEVTLGPRGTQLDYIYPVYASCSFSFSTGLAGLSLGFRGRSRLLAIAVGFFDLINGILTSLAILLNLEPSNLTLFAVFLSVGWLIIMLSYIQTLLIFAFLCPACWRTNWTLYKAEEALSGDSEGQESVVLDSEWMERQARKEDRPDEDPEKETDNEANTETEIKTVGKERQEDEENEPNRDYPPTLFTEYALSVDKPEEDGWPPYPFKQKGFGDQENIIEHSV
ncbi:unnamed protein product [Protopolystoma xenopodis]|uniref:Uncharacterized protein n=1 Tax=Protopolystoma xenopodis TaxID=117903 RepID=A0A3S5A4U3_9PLAT|nr:unnamed protein product [Protopolystoma xenopodis]